MNFNKNRGMLLENIINRTINQYKENDIAIFHKKLLDIKFSAVDNKKNIKNGIIISKSTVDYYGVYKGMFVVFEAKSSWSDTIPKSNFKDHQHNYLTTIKKHGGLAFYIIFFQKTNEFFLADVSLINYKKKSITLEYLKQEAIYLELIFPGVIDFVHYFKFL